MKATIEKVETVEGHTVGSGWRQPMQKITTDKGVYIDRKAGHKGSFWRAPDYSTMEGQEVEFIPVNDNNVANAPAGDRGYYQWMRLE